MEDSENINSPVYFQYSFFLPSRRLAFPGYLLFLNFIIEHSLFDIQYSVFLLAKSLSRDDGNVADLKSLGRRDDQCRINFGQGSD
jgi:hypothetical protein